MAILTCFQCGVELEKEHISLSKKLLGRQIKRFFCINCLAEHLNCSVGDLLVKIDEFKEQGCSLFKKIIKSN